jgi:branched-chain amino acid transport system ATP-binding protein
VQTETEVYAENDDAISTPLLEASGITVRFGGLVALNDVSLQVPDRSTVGVIGPNGAGKSTLLAVLSGFQSVNAGEVSLKGTQVTKLPSHARARAGMARTFQQPELFLSLTIEEHVILAHRVRYQRSRLWRDLLPSVRSSRSNTESEAVSSILETMHLTDIRHESVAGLPLGTSRLVEIARALAGGPDVLLLDEPCSGLDAKEREHLRMVLADLVRQQGVSVVLVEHDIDVVLSLSDVLFVLDFGVCIAHGDPAEVRKDETVLAAYLGDSLLEADSL